MDPTWKSTTAMQSEDAPPLPPGSMDTPMPTRRPTGVQMDFRQWQTIPVGTQQVSYGDQPLSTHLSRATGAHAESLMGQAGQMPPADMTSRDTQPRPLPPGMEFQPQHTIPLSTQCVGFCTPPTSTHLPRAAGTQVESLQTHTGLVDHINPTLPVGADAYIPARHDAQPVCARPQPTSGIQGYAAAGIAERFSGNTQPHVDSTWPRPMLSEGVVGIPNRTRRSALSPRTQREHGQQLCSPKIFGPHRSLVL